MRTTTGWQSTNHSTTLQQVQIERRDLRDDDLAIRVDYCGVCHSDLHAVHGELPGQPPTGEVVPGHEFVGTVTATGAAVTEFHPGDLVAVGTVVDSCGTCPMCLAGQENFCRQGAVSTYGGIDRIDGTITKGAYSREYVVRDKFAYHLPENLDPAATAPLMCAGITVWEPLKAAGVGPGSRVAVAGLGGLGHLAVRFAAALGADVSVLSRTPDKTDDAIAFGAKNLIDTTDEAQLGQAFGSFDVIIDTVSAPHDLGGFINLLAPDGTISVVGWPMETSVQLMALAFGRKKLSASGTGGIKGTTEMLAFAAEHDITATIEVLPSAQVSTSLERLERGDVRYRFVLDLSDLEDVPA